jgi:hypothetical protein
MAPLHLIVAALVAIPEAVRPRSLRAPPSAAVPLLTPDVKPLTPTDRASERKALLRKESDDVVVAASVAGSRRDTPELATALVRP